MARGSGTGNLAQTGGAPVGGVALGGLFMVLAGARAFALRRFGILS